MIVTLLGIDIEVKLAQLPKAPGPMLETLFGILIEDKLAQS